MTSDPGEGERRLLWSWPVCGGRAGFVLPSMILMLSLLVTIWYQMFCRLFWGGGVLTPGGLLLLRGRALETNVTSGMKSASQLLQSKLPESPPWRVDRARCRVRLHNGILGN